MLGEQMQKLRDRMDQLSEAKKGTRPPKTKISAKGSKPDFLDMDKDGDKKEPMKKAVADKKAGPKKGVNPFAKVKEGAKPDFLDMDKDGDEKEPMKKAIKDKKVKEGFPTVADAKARHEKEKTTGKFDKKSTSTGTVYTKKHTKADAEHTPEKKAKAVSEGNASNFHVFYKDNSKRGRVVKTEVKASSPQEAESAFKEWNSSNTPGRFSFVSARPVENIGNMEEGFPTVADAKARHEKEKTTGKFDKKSTSTGTVYTKKHTKADAEHTPEKKKAMSESNFKHNVRFVNESINFLLNEDEEGKAKAITAAGDMVNDFTSWMQRVGQYQTKSMIELADAIRADFGAQEAEAFKQAVGPALSSTLEVLTQQRELISNAVAVLAGEAAPQDAMGMEPDMGAPMEPGMEPAGADMMNPEPAGDEFGAADAAAGGAEAAGRAMRESREQRRARKLAESHSIMAKLAK
jgi:hypothetical protein